MMRMGMCLWPTFRPGLWTEHGHPGSRVVWGEAKASSYEQAKDFVDANRTETLWDSPAFPG